MRNKNLFLIWILYYFVCVGLGFIPEPQGALYGFSVLAGLGFFLPGGILLARFCKTGNQKGLRFLRNLSMLSLALTVATLFANMLAIPLSETAGNVLHTLLILVSVPMVGCRVWILSLFGWACYLVISRYYLKKTGA